jgi:hypothetical protein
MAYLLYEPWSGYPNVYVERTLWHTRELYTHIFSSVLVILFLALWYLVGDHQRPTYVLPHLIPVEVKLLVGT